MASVTFPTALGGDGKTYSDDADPDTGLDGLGYITRLVPLFKNGLAMAVYTAQYAAKIDAAAVNADRAEDAKRYVEAVAEAYKVNLLEPLQKKATIDIDFERGTYLSDTGVVNNTSDGSGFFASTTNIVKNIELPSGFVSPVDNKIHRQWRAGRALGAIIEESRTNLVTSSENLASDSWSKNGNCTVQAGHVAPNGLTSAYRVINASTSSDSTGQDNLRVISLPAVSPSTPYTVSFWIASDELLELRCRFRTGTDSPELTISKSINEDDGWVRVSATLITSASASGSPRLIFYSLGAVAFKLWGVQLEVGRNVSSYISTAGSSVTRPADNLRLNLGPEFSEQRGTIFLSVLNVVPGLSTDFGRIFEISDGSLENRIYMIRRRDGLYSTYVVSDNEQQDEFNNFNHGDDINVAISWELPGKTVTYVNGKKATEGAMRNPLKNLTNLYIGRLGLGSIGSAEFLRILYSPYVATESELEELTAL